MDLHVVIPIVRDGAALDGHPSLLALPPGVEYINAPKIDTYSGSLDLATAPLAPTDAVVDVFALDRSLFDAANAAKRRAHLCVGVPGTLDIEPSLCLTHGPCLPCFFPQLIVCPLCLCYPHIKNLCC